MNKRLIIIIPILLVLGFIIGKLSDTVMNQDIGYIPPLKVVGDVNNVVTLKSFDDIFEKVTIENKDSKIKAFKLQDIINKSSPLKESSELLLLGEDGLMAKIENKNLEKSYITFSDENGWEAINFNHPISSNIKRIKEIVVVSNENSLDIGINIIKDSENIANFTVGQLYSDKRTTLPYFEGKSTVDRDKEEYSTSIYTHKKIFTLEEVVSVQDVQNALIMGEESGYGYYDVNGYFEVKDNYINYIYGDGKKEIEKVKGIMLNPPSISITDSYHDALHFLKNDEKVLLIYLDGFGYHQYQYAIENNKTPILKGIGNAVKASSVYKPVTNAGFAAMITGKSPAENGVYSRKQKDLKTESVFGACIKLNKSTALIEGNIKILNTEIEPILNIDKNSNGTTDDEVFESALKAIDEAHDLVLVHFHGIDDAGHANGDLSEKTMERIENTDKYISKLISEWNGRVIITSDHGMHSTTEGGSHGEFRYEDIIVPYILTKGGIE